MKKLLVCLFAFAAAFSLPALASAQEVETVEESSGLHTGFSLIANLGATYAFYEPVFSGYRRFESSAAGVQGSVDVGYKFEHFGIYFEGLLRGAFAVEDQLDDHCPTFPGSGYNYCYDYKIHKKGEWDGYVGGIALVFRGFIPVTDTFIVTLGGGPILYLGTAVGEGSGFSYSGGLKLELGFNFVLTDELALGFTISEEGSLVCHRSLSPSITLIYNY